MRTKRDPAEAVNGQKPASSDRGHRLIKGTGRVLPVCTRFHEPMARVRSPGRSRHGSHSRCAGALATHRPSPDGWTRRAAGSTGVSVRQLVAAHRSRTNVGKRPPCDPHDECRSYRALRRAGSAGSARSLDRHGPTCPPEPHNGTTGMDHRPRRSVGDDTTHRPAGRIHPPAPWSATAIQPLGPSSSTGNHGSRPDERPRSARAVLPYLQSIAASSH